MQPRTAEQIDEWPSQSFSGGYAGLRDLAAADFSGAVSANGAWLFMLNGHAIGVVDGSLDAFDGASGTAHQAPDDSLPLLFAMRERGGEKRGQYYTERTSLAEVDKTLSSGGFTGYVELSENVLSGDYYVVYYGGNAKYAAFVGQSDRLHTGEDAAERATDEVGLYDVVAVDLSIVELPEAPETADGDTAAGGVAAVSNGTGESEPSVDTRPDEQSASTAEPQSDGPPVDPTADQDEEPPESAVSEPTTSEPTPTESTAAANDLDLESTLAGTSADDSGSDESPPAGSVADDPEPERASPTDTAPEADSTPGEHAPEARDPTADAPTDRPADAPAPAASESEPDESPADPAGSGTAPEGDSTDEAVAASLEEIDLRDPEPPQPTTEGATAAVSEADETSPSAPPVDDADTPADSSVDAAAESAGAAAGGTPDGDDESESELDDLFADAERTSFDEAFGEETTPSADGTGVAETTEAGADDGRVDELRETVETLETENEQLAAERAELVDERDRLQARVGELETELAASKPPADFEQVGPDTALEATDLFVRYRSRSGETLEGAHQGADNRQAVQGNLDLEHHTRFDAERTAVGDEEYETFLPSTLEHQLVTWLVGELLYEIRDTGHVEGLRPLYDALPEIDRADLYGAVEVDAGEDSVPFDVVCRDRLGNPLLCLDVHESRDPATDAEMESVLEKSARVAEDHDEFAGALLVASSFFEPSALELATEKTASGGLFGGGKRESFVKLSRKRGYHLCLVEARDRRFHLTMPEL
ncbi:DUF7527 domain-containing protein [Halomarina rubra]|uniref:Transcriptional regulator n=1 Tax=Halomarina rubra TaxID=2071873 RepID=A0ABD6ASB5_9EURY|nr:hypothetical protein [Halomarina rubra]